MLAHDITFGIEIECSLPMSQSLPVGGYHRGVQVQWLPEGWNAQSDCSVRSGRGRFSVEIVSPILKGVDGLRQALAAVKEIKARGGKVNASCGLHVHIGFPRGDQSALARTVSFVSNHEKAIFAQTGTKSRERGQYSRSIQQHGDTANALRQAGSIRYHVLNLTNLVRGGAPTVEFRAFAGTLNPEKIAGHIRTCIGLVERALAVKQSVKFIGKVPSPTSPLHRSGEGATAMTRLFYGLGWTKGRTDRTYGDLQGEGIPSIAKTKVVLMDLARKYDAQP